MKALIAAVLLAIPALAQGTYWVEVETSLSGAAEVVTLHRPSTGARAVQPTDAVVYCSVACTFTVERDGTAPTATAVSIVKTNSTQSAATATAWKQPNNVGTAARVLPKNQVLAGSSTAIELDDHSLQKGENITIRTSSITGTARIMIRFREY
jgi:hypothetical protein